MIRISIFPERSDNDLTTFSAITATRKATGRTVGEALDALNSHSRPLESAVAIVQLLYPDKFFSALQRDRLEQLMASWRKARQTGVSLDTPDQERLEKLVDEELRAAGERARNISVMEGSKDFSTYQELTSQLRKANDLERRRMAMYHKVELVMAFIQLATLSSCAALLFKGSFSDAIAVLTGSLAIQAVTLICSFSESFIQKRIVSLQEAETNINQLLTLESLESKSEAGSSSGRIPTR